MKKLLYAFILSTIFFSTDVMAQAYLQEAKLLNRFKELYELDPNFVNSISLESVLKVEYADSWGNTTEDQEENPGSGMFETNNAQPSSPKVGIIENQTALKKEFENEKNWCIEFANADFELFNDDKFKNQFEDFPKSFKYLNQLILIMENRSEMAIQTSAAMLGSLGNISQAEIIQGIAEWSLKRAQEELMQAFLREWLETIQSDIILQTMFPNTLNMLSTSELTTIFTDGETWKRTFQQDMDAAPEKIPNIFDIIVNQSGINISPSTRKEIKAGLVAMVDLYSEVGKGKNPADILQLMGEKSFLRTKADGAVMDRSLIALNVFLKSLRMNSQSGSKGFVKVDQLLNLSNGELKSFWCLIYLRERQKINISFKLKTPEDEANVYNEVSDNIHHFRLSMISLSENLAAIENVNKNAKLDKLSIEQFNIYVSLTFDIVVNGLDLLSGFSEKAPDSELVIDFKRKYMPGFEYIALMSEGVQTKSYGLVALNTVNVILWMNEVILEALDKNDIDVDLVARLQRNSEAINKYYKLMASIILAEDKDDIQEALEGAAMKRGGYLLRQKSAFSTSLTFYPGYEYGWEFLNAPPASQSDSISADLKGNYTGVTLPIGIELAMGTNWRPIGAMGLFLQVLDLGAVLNYSINNQSDSVSTLPVFGFQQLLSPGAYITIHLANNPITIGGGISFSPNLREIKNGAAVFQSNALQAGFFIAVDLNIFPIYTSKKKYVLRSKSMKDAYEK